MLDILVAIDMEISIVLERWSNRNRLYAFLFFFSSIELEIREWSERNLRNVLIVLIGCYDTVPELKGT